MQAGSGLSWGQNYFGELGDPTAYERYVPGEVSMPAGVVFTAVATGAFHGTALTSDGDVYAWGLNSNGQLGDGTTTDEPAPVQVALPTETTITQLATGLFHTLALTGTGEVYAWGANWSGQLGDGTTTDRDTPGLVHLPEGVTVASVGAGWTTGFAVASTGELFSWGENVYGQLGDGTTTDRATPVQAQLPTGVTVTAVAGGLDHSLAVTSTGGVLSWGDNASGQLGDGTTTARHTPGEAILPVDETVTGVAAGQVCSFALTTAGGALAWGLNGYGQLGDGTTTDRYIPGYVLLPSGTTLTGIGGHVQTCLAVTSTGLALVWGANGFGQCGDGTATDRYTPVATVLPAQTAAASVDGAWSFSAAVTGPPPQ